jgi:hypothetical protein
VKGCSRLAMSRAWVLDKVVLGVDIFALTIAAAGNLPYGDANKTPICGFLPCVSNTSPRAARWPA